MNLNNFEKEIDQVILKRGFDYFTSHRVEDLEEIEAGFWIADVSGNEIYNVDVKLKNLEILDWFCDCPYDQGSICKHVVAVFYSLKEKKEKFKQKPRKIKNNKNLTVLLNKIPKEELQTFLLLQFKKEKKLKNSFMAYFAEYLDENNDTKYRRIVDNLIKAAKGKYGFIDYRASNNLCGLLYELVEKSNNLLVDKNIVESIAIIKAIIEELPVAINEMDDSGGGVTSVMDYSFETLSTIADQMPPLLKDELFNYCLREYPKEKYSDFGFDDFFIELLPKLITTDEQEKEFFNLIEKQIKELKNDEYSEFTIINLLNAKINFFRRTKRDKEANDVIKENIRYPEFRKILINEAIVEKDYKAAKQLCKEGISIEKNRGFFHESTDYFETLLEISDFEENVNDFRKYAEKLFFNNNYSMKYYRKLKSTYSKDEWSKVCESLINKIKGGKTKGNYRNADALANIFIEEKYFDRLLKLLQINKNNIDFIDHYAEIIHKKYPSELLELYSGAIIELANFTGRRIYEEVSYYLSKMKKIEGGEKEVVSLIGIFREKYKNRTAMKEILNRDFPETIPNPQKKDVQKIINSNLRLL